MNCSLYVIPISILPPTEDGGDIDDLTLREHECCGQQCTELREGVIRIDTRDANQKMPSWPDSGWDLNVHAFYELDSITNHLFSELVGSYESGQCHRLYSRRNVIEQLRVFAGAMTNEHFKAFLTILCDYAESALEQYGREAVIVNV